MNEVKVIFKKEIKLDKKGNEINKNLSMIISCDTISISIDTYCYEKNITNENNLLLKKMKEGKEQLIFYFDELISENLSEAEQNIIIPIIENNGGLWFYDEFIKIPRA